MKGIKVRGNLLSHGVAMAALLAVTLAVVTCDFGTDATRVSQVESDPNQDADGDGWTLGQNDCCDEPGTCANPALVNPGAFEVLGNGVDDDCDAGTADDTVSVCSTAAAFGGVTAAQLSEAMDICRTTTADPPMAERTWGLLGAELVHADGTAADATALGQMQDAQTAVMTAYGTGGVVPLLGATMAGLSTGVMRDADDPGYVVPQDGTDHGRTGSPPPVYLAAHGGQLPASSGCSGSCPAGSGANDSVNLRLTLRVPTNARGLSYGFRFFSSEFPEWTCTQYNDFYLALLTTGAAGIPADMNISYDSLGNPVSVNNGFFEVCAASGCYTCPLGTGELAGTGMDGDVGGGTAWLRTRAPVVPGETITLELMVFDVSDGILDSLVLLDGFRWIPDPTAVGTNPAP